MAFEDGEVKCISLALSERSVAFAFVPIASGGVVDGAGFRTGISCAEVERMRKRRVGVDRGEDCGDGGVDVERAFPVPLVLPPRQRRDTEAAREREVEDGAREDPWVQEAVDFESALVSTTFSSAGAGRAGGPGRAEE